MNTDQKRDGTFRGLQAEVSDVILGVFFDVYNEPGGGFGSRPGFKRFLLDNEQKKVRVDPRESVVRTSYSGS